jgi:E3 ubiquitin-protein ligase RNF38/44
VFSVTFLLLLYAKHCKRGSVVVIGHAPPSSAARKNSGIDRNTIESLPVFRFGSLRGQKDGLECAVCLTRFESSEVLRLLPKCKHAFHVECVDTWLDAHSTCPLCRYRVDPEDVLLIDEAKILPETHPVPPPENDFVVINVEGSNPGIRRVSGRHSSAGERGTGLLQFVLQRAAEAGPHDPASFRRSLDSAGLRKKSEPVAVGCFDRPRKDGLLLTDDRTSSLERTRFEHRIIVSPRAGGFHQRWSDVQPSDLLYLQSEMIMSDGRRFSSSESGSGPRARQQQHRNISGRNGWWGGRGVINARSVSEITGLSRFPNTNVPAACSNQIHSHDDDDDVDSRRAGVVSRWLAWISQSRPAPAVRLGRTTGIAA